MIRAVWNGTVLAEAPRTVRVEGNHYFPPESLHREHLRKPDHVDMPMEGSGPLLQRRRGRPLWSG